MPVQNVATRLELTRDREYVSGDAGSHKCHAIIA